MLSKANGELIWHRANGLIRLTVYGTPREKQELGASHDTTMVQVSNTAVRWVTVLPEQVVYRHPVELAVVEGRVVAGPVFAILAGSGRKVFHGNRNEYRGLVRTGRSEGRFVYVLPAGQVTDQRWWRGYVPVGKGQWVAIPCPHAEAVYNRIPTRNLERTPVVEAARARLQLESIPMFNPSYFNKAELYQVIAASHTAHYLPETFTQLDGRRLRDLLSRHSGVYLKPSGGSVGHGMMLAEHAPGGYKLSVMKQSHCQTYTVTGFETLWNTVLQQRLPGNYVLQAAVPLIEWNDRPCDFRVLLQKHSGNWVLVGTGVRVAGEGAITTHVPNGGHIAAAEPVVRKWFGNRAAGVLHGLEAANLELARTVDRHYQGALGEMSIDIGIDRQGNIWFLEANSKPMKFDEPEIFERSLHGVLTHLDELRVQ